MGRLGVLIHEEDRGETTHTITSWARRTETLSEVRRKGYATNIEELEYGYRSVAAPIRDGRGRTIAALSVDGSTHRVTMERIPELAKAVREAAARLARRLGYRGQPDQVAAPLLPTRRNNRRGTQP